MRLILAAATDWRTLIWLGAGVVAAAALSNPFPMLIGLGIYVWAVQRLASSPSLKEEAERVRIAEAMAARYRAIQAEASYVASSNRVLTAVREIYHEWLAHPDQRPEKTQLVEDAMQMALLYLRMSRAYHAIYDSRTGIDLTEVHQRIERNRKALEQSMDLQVRASLSHALEMDERVLAQVEAERAERERYQAKLVAIESTMELLRRQMYDPELTAEGASLRDMLLEAEAMDEALQEVQRRRIRA